MHDSSDSVEFDIAIDIPPKKIKDFKEKMAKCTDYTKEYLNNTIYSNLDQIISYTFKIFIN